ncbi:MAG: methyltransferase domain-containing protein [Alphaproteobacteria bacterium]|nr:MAG: methyltransferase domain-containing protein [Alphaproteobacteria bacterium]
MGSEDENLEAPAEKKGLFKKRLKAWWDGYELEKEKAAAIAVDDSRDYVPAPEEGPPTVKGWSISRQKSVVTLFGEGMVRSIPDDTKTKLTRPLGINKKLSITELGSGLGGFARWTSETYNAYVTGYEEDLQLLDAATEMTVMAGLNRKVNFMTCDFDNFDPKERSADIVYASEALFCVQNKEKCFQAIRRMLKPTGQFMMSDFMLEGTPVDAPELAAWRNSEPRLPYLLDVQAIRKLLSSAGFEVSIAENVSETYKANVLRAFADYAKRTSDGEKSGHLHEWILKEGEMWMRRIKLMEDGHLKVFRIYARVPSEII